MEIGTVGVIGAGVMGRGVAHNLVETRHQVVLVDVDDERLAEARDAIEKSLSFQGFFDKSNAVDVDAAMARVRFTTAYADLAAVDFVVENVTEKWEIKQPVYEQLDEICPAPCVFAANTSAVPITKIASVTQRPDRVLGIHFMNPVPKKPTVELIKGYHTSEDALAIAGQLLTAMGKDYVLVNDAPGFISNRVLMLTVNEAIYLLHEHVAEAADVDKVFTSCFGHPMGPLATADLIGLDTILYSLDVLCESFNDSKYRPCPLLKQMVAAGLHGRKNGRGFYTYED